MFLEDDTCLESGYQRTCLSKDDRCIRGSHALVRCSWSSSTAPVMCDNKAASQRDLHLEPSELCSKNDDFEVV